MKKATSFLVLTSILISFVGCNKNQSTNYISFVDPLIGSGGHGHVFVGANVPNGMVQLGPVNVSQGWDWCSGYHISDTTVIGFAHTHLSGTGIGDKGDVIVMPLTGNNDWTCKEKYLTTYSHKNEVAEPGYYEVKLDNGVKVRLTSAKTVGYHEYYFPEDKEPQILINLKQGIGWDAFKEGEFIQTSSRTVSGSRISTGWAEDDRVYFSMNFNTDIKSIEHQGDTIYDNKTGEVKQIFDSCYYLLKFEKTDKPVCLEVGISGVDIKGAENNLQIEGGRQFEDVKTNAQKYWNNYLAKIDVQSNDTTKLKIFYTALFHTGFFPCLFSDFDGRYRGADGKIHQSDEPQLTIMSLWDTYRAQNPLYTIINKDDVPSIVNSMLNIYDQQGSLPVWHLSGNETYCMPGVSSVQIIADAIMKDMKGFDYDRAYKAMRSYADLDYRGLEYLRTIGYLPADSMYESVARALEYCVSDAAIAAVADKLGYEEDAGVFLERSKSYKQYFDPGDRFMKALTDKNTRRTPFDPTYSRHNQDDYCEGNGWQYTWFVPCDFEGLISLFPSTEDAESKLDSLFTVPYIPAENASADISGMIGQYAHGNEPSHSTIFAYCFMGKPEKTAKLARYITTELYTALPDGQPGNEDCGQMSAWYVLNAMGFYQPNPWDGKFYISSPLFDKVTINLGNNHKFTIIANGFDSDNYYHKSASLDGKPYNLPYFTYEDMEKFNTLVLNAK